MKTLRNLVLIAGVILLSAYTTQAQMLREYSAFHKSIGVDLGSIGIGIEGNYPIGYTLNLRGGFNYVPPVKVSRPGGIGSSQFEFDRSNVNLMLDWQPLFGKESDFASKWFITIGAGYFFKNQLQKYDKNDLVNPEYTIDFKQAPYIGTGLGNLVLGERISLSLNVGYYFEYSDAIAHRKKADVLLPHLEKFPQSVLKGIDAHAGITYNF